MPLVQTRGAASAQGFGEFAQAAAAVNYIEEVFSTYLYTGNGATQTITNNIDLSTKGGLVWTKGRSTVTNHGLYDTSRGATKYLMSNLTSAESTRADGLTSFLSTGYTLGADAATESTNANGYTYASWTFRKQPKFFDVVTYTGNGVAGRTVAHSLTSVPGCFIVKCTSNGSTEWFVYHRSLTSANYHLRLSETNAEISLTTAWNDTAPTSSVFTLGTDDRVNGSGRTYVAYIFAHDAGGFGLTGSDNVISCGSFTTNGSGAATVSLGYEPQWFLFKRSDDTSNWRILDVMRGGSLTQSSPLTPNLSSAESSFGSFWSPTATGFNIINQAASSTWIYIAIRRGPMAVPTTGTSVFSPLAYTGDATNRVLSTGFPVDMTIISDRNNSSSLVGYKQFLADRLQGNANAFSTSITDPWGGGWGDTYFDFTNNTGLNLSSINSGYLNNTSTPYVSYNFSRRPGFFDQVCYTGTSTSRTVTHNLTVAPELMIVKRINTSGFWAVYANNDNTDYLVLNTNAATVDNITYWNDTSPTSSVFTVGSASETNGSGSTYAAYLFATCAGVSKVGSYTGNGSSQTINCGFTGGARFILIKKSSGTGDWMVSDSARGIIAGSDPYLELNNTNAEVTGEDWLDTDSTGFVVNEVSGSNANTNGATYIFLAIA